MKPISLTSMVLFVWFHGFSSSSTAAAIDQCDKICRHKNLSWVSQTWCCETYEICGEVAGECIASGLRWWAYVVTIISIIFIVICIGGRCILICLDCCKKNSSNTIYQSTYAPVATTSIRIDEESPPSYEQVMRNDTVCRFENPR